MAFRLDPATLMFATAMLAFLSSGFSFLFANGTPGRQREGVEWGRAMLALGGACMLWFLHPMASMLFTFFFANALAVLAGVFVTRAFLRLVERPSSRAASIGLAALGMSGIIATYDFGAPRLATVLSIALCHLAMVAICMRRLMQGRNKLPLSYCRVMLAVLFLLGVTIVWRLWVALFGAGALAVSPFASTDAVLATIAACCLLIVAGSFGFFGMLSDRQQQLLLEMARRDALTGLYNRGAFFELAQQSLEKPGASCALLMIDLDHFKTINDTHGHAAGDAVIRHAARLVQQHIRVQDIAGRYGGEELCVFLPGCGADAARDIAARIHAEIARQSVRLTTGGNISYTVSLGYVAQEARATQAEERAPTLAELLGWADAALYQAKRLGRNRIHAASTAERGLAFCLAGQ
ncbi:GGDEF domain-containing protein [Noviherbaspirillum pedocola]|uniref:diguanylate cyclase n=1 Tax=Noviherbaspirillum pedocola TaxID=2801341 RepID=A0A934SZ40_9BURK|nr:GGDEF domain-containing protein [Noviherbaspirillum pedocola]MBK4734393.1 GGDEF domain-containing protein [Noviherbaspirillum pedocola]